MKYRSVKQFSPKRNDVHCFGISALVVKPQLHQQAAPFTCSPLASLWQQQTWNKQEHYFGQQHAQFRPGESSPLLEILWGEKACTDHSAVYIELDSFLLLQA